MAGELDFLLLFPLLGRSSEGKSDSLRRVSSSLRAAGSSRSRERQGWGRLASLGSWYIACPKVLSFCDVSAASDPSDLGAALLGKLRCLRRGDRRDRDFRTSPSSRDRRWSVGAPGSGSSDQFRGKSWRAEAVWGGFQGALGLGPKAAKNGWTVRGFTSTLEPNGGNSAGKAGRGALRGSFPEPEGFARPEELARKLAGAGLGGRASVGIPSPGPRIAVFDQIGRRQFRRSPPLGDRKLRGTLFLGLGASGVGGNGGASFLGTSRFGWFEGVSPGMARGPGIRARRPGFSGFGSGGFSELGSCGGLVPIEERGGPFGLAQWFWGGITPGGGVLGHIVGHEKRFLGGATFLKGGPNSPKKRLWRPWGETQLNIPVCGRAILSLLYPGANFRGGNIFNQRCTE